MIEEDKYLGINEVEETENIEIKNKHCLFSRKIIILILSLLILLSLIIVLVLVFRKNNHSEPKIITNYIKKKNLLYIVQDASYSLKQPYNNLILKSDGLKTDLLLKFLEFYSFFNRTDIYATLLGTQPEISYDLLGIFTELSTIEQSDIDYKIAHYDEQKIYQCSNPDYDINVYLNKYSINIDKFLSQTSKNKKCVLAFYLKDDNYLRQKVYENLKEQNKNIKEHKWWDFFHLFDKEYIFIYPKELFLNNIIEDMTQLVIKETIDFEKHKNSTIHSILNVYDAIKAVKEKLKNQLYGDISINDILNLFKDNIYGESYLVETLTKIKDEIMPIKDDYDNKIIFLITDGKSSDGSIKNIVEEIKKEANVYIIVLFVSSHDLNRPKELFNNLPDNLYDYEKDLFEASSSLNSNLEMFSYLNKQDIKIPKNGQIKLFFQGNDQYLINVLLKSLENIFENHDLLLDLVGKVELKKYVGESIGDFSPKNQGNEGTCYAFASATAIHLTLVRLKGDKSPPFEGIKKYLINKYGIKGYSVPKLLTAELGQYKLHFKEVDEKGAREAVNRKRVCVVTFFYTNREFAKFQTFFKKDPKGILSKEIMDEIEPYEYYLDENRDNNKISGHAVVLISSQIEYLRLLNSWGIYFGEQGFFKLKNSKVFREMHFYELYWDDNDLTQTELEEHKKFKKMLSVDYFKNTKNYEELCNYKVECPYCHEESRIKDFQGNLNQVKCPICEEFFDVKDEKLAQKLYFDFINL